MQPSTSKQDIYSLRPSRADDYRTEIFYQGKDTEKQGVYSQFIIPGDDNSLFWAVTLAYLLPVKDNTSFSVRYKELFGGEETVFAKISCVRESIHKYNPFSRSIPTDEIFKNLVQCTMRNRVVDFMDSNLDRFEYSPEVADEQYRFNMRNPDTRGDHPEIEAISMILNCRINVDGQIFPMIFKNKLKNPKSVILKLYRMKHPTATAQDEIHFNYGLEKWIHVTFRANTIHYVLERLEMYISVNPDIGVNDCNSSHNFKHPGKTPTKKSSKSASALKKRKSKVRANTKVAYRINDILQFDALFVNKLADILQEYQKSYIRDKKPAQEDIIREICFLFQKPKHVGCIFQILNIFKEKILLRYAFVVLKIIIHELYKNENYDLVRRIINVKEVHSVKNVFLTLDSSDEDVLEFQLIEAQTMNKIGLYEDALAILNSMLENIIHAEDSNVSDEIIRESTNASKFHLSLLTTNYIAYTKHLMGECEKSYNEYKTLLVKIMEYLGVTGDANSLSYTMYKDILQSENYQNIASFSQEYLSILHIRENMAHELVCLGDECDKILQQKELRFSADIFRKAVECYQNAINIHEDNIGKKGISANFNYDIFKNVQVIADAYNKLGNLIFCYLNNLEQNATTERLHEIVDCYYKSFEIHSVRVTCSELWTTHKIDSKFVTDIILILNNTVSIHKKCGILKLNTNLKAAFRSFNNALFICELLYKFFVKILGKEHLNTLNMNKDIVFLKDKIENIKVKCILNNSKVA